MGHYQNLVYRSIKLSLGDSVRPYWVDVACDLHRGIFGISAIGHPSPRQWRGDAQVSMPLRWQCNSISHAGLGCVAREMDYINMYDASRSWRLRAWVYGPTRPLLRRCNRNRESLPILSRSAFRCRNHDLCLQRRRGASRGIISCRVQPAIEPLVKMIKTATYPGCAGGDKTAAL